MLILICNKDVQVDWRADAGPLQTATLRMANAAFVFPDNADHVLKVRTSTARGACRR